jgi:hypothetical protein
MSVVHMVCSLCVVRCVVCMVGSSCVRCVCGVCGVWFACEVCVAAVLHFPVDGGVTLAPSGWARRLERGLAQVF